MAKVPEMINDSRTYINGNANYYPTSEFEPPELATLTTDVTGVGFSGKMSAPVVGQLDSMEAKMTMRVPVAEAMALSAGEAIEMENYADVQNFDAGANETVHAQMRAAIRGRVKSVNPGKLQRGETTDTELTVEVTYFKADFDGKNACEIDKFGYKAIINGKDLLEDVRKNLGM